uniref:BPTI/Kunitz inhibitor domain-containing protein n=1 Tax=Monopterus albus TaxID=43700 RepID=A0A3Q3K586_MONAL
LAQLNSLSLFTQFPGSDIFLCLLSVHCRQPMKVGPCRAAFPRFYYNVTNQSCSSFIYGGCGGNGNNFVSQEECETNCTGVTGTTQLINSAAMHSFPDAPGGTVASEAGPCRAAFPRWYFNSKTGSCESFVYGGCKGNRNNYDSEESCNTACPEHLKTTILVAYLYPLLVSALLLFIFLNWAPEALTFFSPSLFFISHFTQFGKKSANYRSVYNVMNEMCIIWKKVKVSLT